MPVIARFGTQVESFQRYRDIIACEGARGVLMPSVERKLVSAAAPGNPPPRIPGRRGCRDCGGRLRRRAIRRGGSSFHGAKKQLQACFAQPGDEMLRWMSPGRTPSQYIVNRWPTG